MSGPRAEASFTIDELAAVTGVASRTIRLYQTKRVLPPPPRRGRVSCYGPDYVDRLRLIGELQDRGLQLCAIRDLLNQCDGGVTVREWLGLGDNVGRSRSDGTPLRLTSDEPPTARSSDPRLLSTLPPGDRARALAMDRADPLARFRERFVYCDRDVIYLCGNSLGRQARAAAEHVAVAMQQWADRLVDGWDDWLDLPSRVGDLMAEPILGARPGEVVVSDSTSVNLYKLARAAMASSPGRDVVVTDSGDFPTDRYVLEGLGRRRLISADPVAGPTVDDLVAALDDQVSLVCLSHVAYRSGAVADMAGITAVVHEAGALVLWDLSHSAGCYPVALEDTGADLAVGCTYKYLSAGPGAPAHLYVRRELQGRLRQPIWGWFGQRDQFAMGPCYEPWPDVRQFLVGTPPVIGLAAVQGGVEVIAEAGIAAIRDKALALGQLAAELHLAWLAPKGFMLGSPDDPALRGSHLALRHADAPRIHRALGGVGRVITDFRPPDTIRLGLAPLTTRFVDVWDGLDRLRALTY